VPITISQNQVQVKRSVMRLVKPMST